MIFYLTLLLASNDTTRELRNELEKYRMHLCKNKTNLQKIIFDYSYEFFWQLERDFMYKEFIKYRLSSCKDHKYSRQLLLSDFIDFLNYMFMCKNTLDISRCSMKYIDLSVFDPHKCIKILSTNPFDLQYDCRYDFNLLTKISWNPILGLEVDEYSTFHLPEFYVDEDLQSITDYFNYNGFTGPTTRYGISYNTQRIKMISVYRDNFDIQEEAKLEHKQRNKILPNKPVNYHADRLDPYKSDMFSKSQYKAVDYLYTAKEIKTSNTAAYIGTGLLIFLSFILFIICYLVKTWKRFKRKKDEKY